MMEPTLDWQLIRLAPVVISSSVKEHAGGGIYHAEMIIGHGTGADRGSGSTSEAGDTSEQDN
jgi:hypothetical protein